MLERLGLADPVVAVAVDVLDQGVDPLEDLAVLALPPHVVRPGALVPNDLHSVRSRAVPPPASSRSIDISGQSAPQVAAALSDGSTSTRRCWCPRRSLSSSSAMPAAMTRTRAEVARVLDDLLIRAQAGPGRQDQRPDRAHTRVARPRADRHSRTECAASETTEPAGRPVGRSVL
jgi:hypothetical protein